MRKKVEELANGTASARDLNRDLSRFSNPPPIGNRLGGEKFKDRDAGAASCQLLNHFVYILLLLQTQPRLKNAWLKYDSRSDSCCFLLR
jgi:hypothetical protein